MKNVLYGSVDFCFIIKFYLLPGLLRFTLKEPFLLGKERGEFLDSLLWVLSPGWCMADKYSMYVICKGSLKMENSVESGRRRKSRGR